jgi:hypothetical protein
VSAERDKSFWEESFWEENFFSARAPTGNIEEQVLGFRLKAHATIEARIEAGERRWRNSSPLKKEADATR